MNIGDGVQATDGYFSAFVSYSHVDQKAAGKLHRKLEAYRLPKDVATSLNSDEVNNSRRLGRIFRDREDLPAAEDLSTSVKAALQVSDVLIILCSPDAKASKWVTREIELFRQLHPDRPILAAILRGEPDDAFPDILKQGREPLAADLRKEGDGARLGFLKIVAGVAGIPLDALIQRDAQRRVRRVMAITAGSMVAMLAMVIMTMIAIQSRNEAQHQRAEAEELVEFMLTDLRNELKGASTLRVRNKVNARAFDYYKDQGDLSDLPADSLGRRARTLHAWGEDDERSGDVQKALIKFQEAHRVTKELLARDPENPDRIFDHAQSEYWVGFYNRKDKSMAKAVPFYQNYLKLAKRLQAQEGNTKRALLEMAFAENNMGIMALNHLNDAEQSREYFLSELRRYNQIGAKQLSDEELIYKSNCLAWIADTYYSQSDFQNSLAYRQDEISIKERLLGRDPQNYKLMVSLAKALRSISVSYEKLGQNQPALRALNSAATLSSKAIKFDPQNDDWKKLYQRIQKMRE